jgi:hypothetical protein
MTSRSKQTAFLTDLTIENREIKGKETDVSYRLSSHPSLATSPYLMQFARKSCDKIQAASSPVCFSSPKMSTICGQAQDNQT